MHITSYYDIPRNACEGITMICTYRCTKIRLIRNLYFCLTFKGFHKTLKIYNRKYSVS